MRRVLPASAETIALVGFCGFLLGAAACHFDVSGVPISSTFDGFAGTGDGGVDAALRPGFIPSNVSPTHVQEGASSLASPQDIDTEKLLIDGNPPPTGVVFGPEATHDEWAVLSVRDLTIDTDVKVHGRRALIVVAVGDVRISAVLHGEATLRIPGPGGQFTGAGRGSDGKSSGGDDSGGGGGGHGAPGAAGGDSTAEVNGEGGLGGPTFTMPFSGGSGGGDGAGANDASHPCAVGQGWSAGGAGGGAIQISAKMSIDLSASGGINVGGGGGRGGCLDSASAGGGGGSGGTVWLEAPTLRLSGTLAANGGGGGSGGNHELFNDRDGKDGSDGVLALDAAPGGMSVASGSGAGGSGGFAGNDAAPGDKATNGGGGGGAIGRIRLRTRGSAPITDPMTVMSPEPELTVDF